MLEAECFSIHLVKMHLVVNLPIVLELFDNQLYSKKFEIMVCIVMSNIDEFGKDSEREGFEPIFEMHDKISKLDLLEGGCE